MKLVAWDTSSKAGALVAIEWGQPARDSSSEPFRIVSEWTLDVDTSQHAERLLWGVHQMLEASNWRLEDVDYFGVGVGPGSFTGLRIGVTTARTLAHALGKPLVGVSSLAALARPVALHYADQPRKTLVIATSDAAKGELFALYGSAKSVVDCVAMADGDRPGSWKRGVEEDVLPPETIMKGALKKLSEGTAKNTEKTRWVRVGPGRTRYPEQWKLLPKTLEVECPLPGVHSVQGRYLGSLVWEAIQAGLARPALEVHPRYLRLADAEKKLRAGELAPAPSRQGKKSGKKSP